MSERNRPKYERTERTHKLSFAIKLYQGIGAIPDTIMNWTFSTFILLFYNRILGVDALLVSAALALALALDAVVDPVVATMSDNLHTRWGRRHPLMLIGSLPLGLTTFLIFSPPAGLGAGGLFAWLFSFVLLTRIAMSVFFVPWGAIAVELSDDYVERTSVMAFRYAVGWAVGVTFPWIVFSYLMPGATSQPVGQLNPANYPYMAAAAGALICVGGLVTTLLTWNQIPHLRRHIIAPPRPGVKSVLREIVVALKNDQFALMFTIILLASTIAGTTANIGIFMATYFWLLTPDNLRWFALSVFGAVIAIPLVTLLQRSWEKKQILLVASAIALGQGMIVVALRLVHILPPNGSPWLLPILVVDASVAAGISVVQGIIFASMIADILDLQELKTGLRQEAMFAAALSFSGKAVTGIGIVVGGLVLKLIAIPANIAPANVPPDVVLRLGVIAGLALPLLFVLPIWLVRRYTISRQVLADIRQQLTQREM